MINKLLQINKNLLEIIEHIKFYAKIEDKMLLHEIEEIEYKINDIKYKLKEIEKEKKWINK